MWCHNNALLLTVFSSRFYLTRSPERSCIYFFSKIWIWENPVFFFWVNDIHFIKNLFINKKCHAIIDLPKEERRQSLEEPTLADGTNIYPRFMNLLSIEFSRTEIKFLEWGLTAGLVSQIGVRNSTASQRAEIKYL